MTVFITFATAATVLTWIAAALAMRADSRAQAALRESLRLADAVAEVVCSMQANDPPRLTGARVALDTLVSRHPYRLGPGVKAAPMPREEEERLRYRCALEAIATIDRDRDAQLIAKKALG
jgi:hypothetical protein